MLFLKGWYREISFLVPYGMRGFFLFSEKMQWRNENGF
ncbi:hypothetical protein Bateq7PJ16_1714 [Bacillus subtilis]|nr:hypothetical protein Bateq7PJ16_1714 [Bacillus subtilis]